MGCYHPLVGWYSKKRSENGKRGVVFNLADGCKDLPISVPCGKCIGCRQTRERAWAVRCLHESKMHESNWFVTLTYDDEHLPANGSLSKRDWQLFMKRFRLVYGPVRFFMCGQYGEQSLRAHYHALLFGVDFPDARLYGDGKLWVSKRLCEVWGLGDVKLGLVSLGSIHYVTAYMGRSTLDKEKCSVFGLEPEFQLMSRRPGIGASWLRKYWRDVYWGDGVVLRGGVKVRPPRYYDEWMEEVDSVLMEKLKMKRRLSGKGDYDALFRQRMDVERSGKRLIVKEAVAEGKRKFFSGMDPD